MEGIGERLKRKREQMGLSIEQAAEATRFRPELIEAVEEGRPGLFSAPVYQDGFIRGYARMLGLDGEALIREQKTEEERAQEALRGIRMHPPRTSKLRRTAVVVIVVAVAGVLASILIDRLVTRPRVEPEEGTPATREAAGSAAPDSAGRGSPTAGSRKMDYIPEPRDEATPPEEATPSATGSLGGASVADLYRGRSGLGAQQGQNQTSSEAPAGEDRGAQAARPGPTLPSEGGAAGPPGAGTAPSSSTRTGAVQAQSATGARSLEVAAGRHSVYLILASGEQIIYDGWVYGGMRKMFRGDEFVIVSLSSVEGVSVTLDGRPVALPVIDPAAQKSIGDWPVR
jgi:cytoskeleton protein RodZ